jgi:hypothetical protein
MAKFSGTYRYTQPRKLPLSLSFGNLPHHKRKPIVMKPLDIHECDTPPTHTSTLTSRNTTTSKRSLSPSTAFS